MGKAISGMIIFLPMAFYESLYFHRGEDLYEKLRQQKIDSIILLEFEKRWRNEILFVINWLLCAM